MDVKGHTPRWCLDQERDLGSERHSDAEPEGATGMEGTGMNQTGDMNETGDTGDMKTGDMESHAAGS
jgi:hypothetical protein